LGQLPLFFSFGGSVILAYQVNTEVAHQEVDVLVAGMLTDVVAVQLMVVHPGVVAVEETNYGYINNCRHHSMEWSYRYDSLA